MCANRPLEVRQRTYGRNYSTSDERPVEYPVPFDTLTVELKGEPDLEATVEAIKVIVGPKAFVPLDGTFDDLDDVIVDDEEE